MATKADNTLYLDFDGTQLDTYFQDFGYDPSMETNDTTAGSSTSWRTFAEGLKSGSLSLTIVYDTTNAATILPLIEVGTHTITIGPEGTTAGKPKHVQAFIITGVSLPISVNKTTVSQVVAGTASAAPTTDMYSGGVWT